MSNVYPSIPDPTPTVESLAETVRTLKMAVELLTGQRTGGAAAHTFTQEATPTALEVGDLWIVPSTGSVSYWDGSNWLALNVAAASTSQQTSSSSSIVTPGMIAPGDVGQGLITTISGGVEWAYSARVKLGVVQASASGFIGFTDIFNGYNNYEIVLTSVVPVTTAVGLYLQWYAGGAYLATGYATYTAIFNSGGSASSVPTTYIDLCGGARLSNVVNEGALVRLLLTNASDASRNQQWLLEATCYDTGVANYNRIWGGGRISTTSRLTGFKVYTSAGNLSTGACTVYGLA